MTIRMLVALALASACGLGAGSARAEGLDLAAAEAAYAETCARCHGRTGKGMASFPSIAGKDEAYIAERLATYRSGEKVGPNSLLMIPVATDLSDEEIASLAAYVSATFR